MPNTLAPRAELFRHNADAKRVQRLGVQPCDFLVAEPGRLRELKPIARRGHVRGPHEAGTGCGAIGPEPPCDPVVVGGRGRERHRLAMKPHGAAGERAGVDVHRLSGTVDALELDGRDLDIRPSDNVAMLKRLGKDPHILKESRIDALYGLVNLMDAALAATPRVQAPALLLYGEKDELIPNDVFRAMLERLPSPRPEDLKIAIYGEGFHMLLRDLKAAIVLEDVVAWIKDRETALPSGAEGTALAWIVRGK